MTDTAKKTLTEQFLESVNKAFENIQADESQLRSVAQPAAVCQIFETLWNSADETTPDEEKTKLADTLAANIYRMSGWTVDPSDGHKRALRDLARDVDSARSTRKYLQAEAELDSYVTDLAKTIDNGTSGLIKMFHTLKELAPDYVAPLKLPQLFKEAAEKKLVLAREQKYAPVSDALKRTAGVLTLLADATLPPPAVPKLRTSF